jgi:Flp pilus assembly protein TadG
MRHVGSTRTNFDRRGRRRGQALVEFALVIPIFLLLLFGVVDFGRLIYMNSTVSQAAREGARLASVEAMWVNRTDSNCNAVGGPVCPANVAALRADVLAAANRMMAPFGAIADADLYTSCDATTPPTPVTTKTCAPSAPGGLVSVRVVLTYRPITPLISSFFSSIPTSGSATMVIN